MDNLTRLMAALERISLDALELVLRFAEFLAIEEGREKA